MRPIFHTGDVKTYRHVVRAEDQAAFHGAVVHAVCSTFALARDVEWTSRQFVLDMRDDDEEGIGTFLHIEHKSPAFAGEEIVFMAKVIRLEGHELVCSFEATVGDRLIATGQTGQKILKREKIDRIFNPHHGR